jgi:hypothetical protein
MSYRVIFKCDVCGLERPVEAGIPPYPIRIDAAVAEQPGNDRLPSQKETISGKDACSFVCAAKYIRDFTDAIEGIQSTGASDEPQV